MGRWGDYIFEHKGELWEATKRGAMWILGTWAAVVSTGGALAVVDPALLGLTDTTLAWLLVSGGAAGIIATRSARTLESAS